MRMVVERTLEERMVKVVMLPEVVSEIEVMDGWTLTIN